MWTSTALPLSVICWIVLLFLQLDLAKANCGGDVIGAEGVLKSPGYPREYGPNLTCTWRITVPEKHHVVLKFRVFRIESDSDECRYDYLEIRDGHESKSPVLGRFCGYNNHPDVRSTGNKMNVTFVSDATTSYARFKLEFVSETTQTEDTSSETNCGEDFIGTEGVLKSPGYPEPYGPNLTCTWRITVPEKHHVVLKFRAFRIESDSDECRYDYLEIRDGHESKSPVLGRFCGYNNHPDIRSTGNKMNVTFVADATTSYVGFKLEFVSEITQTEDASPENIKLAKRKLVNWFLGRRKNETGISKWGHELPRIAVALFLANKDFSAPGNRTMEEMNYELTIRLLSQIAGGWELRRRDLSLSIHALTVACVDPKDFHGRDLVSELRAHVSTGNGTAFELLVLCNAGDAMSDKDVERIAEIFDSQHRPFWTDNQAMATLALACVSSRGGVAVDERTLLDMAQELKKRQFRNGTVDNLKTTALVVQALIATRSLDRDFDLSAALSVLLRAQREDGSVGSLLDSYYVLPVLANSSLLDVTSSHCKKPTTTESEALSELRVSRGRRVRVQFSVWIGTEADLWRTWTLKVPANSSLYGLLETVNKLDSRQQVEYNVIDGKPYVSSLMDIQDDVETGFYWFTYLRTQSTEDTKLVEGSPVDVQIRAKQELILWYKSGPWIKHSTPESLA